MAMRDHREGQPPLSPGEERQLQEITARLNAVTPRLVMSAEAQARRKAKRQRQAASRRANR